MALPGIHPKFDFSDYSSDERKIIHRFASEWFITTSTRPLQLSEKSVYRAFLARPCEPISEMFNLEKEVIVVFSSYDDFEVRTIDAFDAVADRFTSLRIDTVCRILVSKDKKIVERVFETLKNDPELPVIIPFTYDELLVSRDKYIIQQRFRQQFFQRDLFAFESPLKRDTYFFGRMELINDIIARHKSNENSALFGLRRSGKTSIVFGLERASKINSQAFVSVDCQSPSVHKRRWYELLPYVVGQIIFKYQLKKTILNIELYSELNAADQFFTDIKTIYTELKRTPVVLAFDEIERISPGTGSSVHWAKGDDFISFWQAIRSAAQRHTGVFSYILIGTNPQCIETAFINGQDNPIFNAVPIGYIPGFDQDQTSEMVRKLGRYMGLNFADGVFLRLHDDFGGHPYLIRHVCSIMHKMVSTSRPTQIDKTVYEKAKQEFVSKYANYTEMILDVIVRDFPDEYILLQSLATEDTEMFNAFAEESSVSHLVGYGLIARGVNGYYFKIESVKEHLRKKSKYNSVVSTNAERITEIAARRVILEPTLRRLVLSVYSITFGQKAKTEAAQLIKGQALTRLEEKGFNQALQPNSIDLNFSDLAKLISGKWQLFKNLFSMKQLEFDFYMEAIRVVRTEEAHSGSITNAEFIQARIAFHRLEEDLRDAGFMMG
ncbi:ATP-binding protein [Rhizobium ruizarguesonis]|uniref:hypothetical protein n=1 Tax=Rhizobium ruizarguesonis TaxID=2081791 RepID=UPI00103168B8|nr:hypothetical protein [Rhizobium ruizarguesonis]TAU01490.1 hypothetical protein ELI53_19125 [Rhizobium ruizarguesonis]